jgi:hypothetical protein
VERDALMALQPHRQPGVDHFSLPSNPSLLARLIADANAPRSNCS